MGASKGMKRKSKKKIRFGQIDGGFFTGNGLGAVAKEARILEIPGVVKSENAKDIYNVIKDPLQPFFESRGYHLLGLIEVGHAYFFSKKKIQTIEDIRNTKMWVWKGDEFAAKMMGVLNVPSVAVDFTEVIPSLQTGLIDGVYSTPAGLISLEWHKEVNYMLDLPLTLVSSGVVFSKKKWDSLDKKERDALEVSVSKAIEKYRTIIRELDERSLQALKKSGLQFLPPQAQDKKIYTFSKELFSTFPSQLKKSIEKSQKSEG